MEQMTTTCCEYIRCSNKQITTYNTTDVHGWQ